jgi:hypothetical protein
VGDESARHLIMALPWLSGRTSLWLTLFAVSAAIALLNGRWLTRRSVCPPTWRCLRSSLYAVCPSVGAAVIAARSPIGCGATPRRRRGARCPRSKTRTSDVPGAALPSRAVVARYRLVKGTLLRVN